MNNSTDLDLLDKTDTLLVVETDDDWFIGTVVVDDFTVTIMTGFAGRPKVLHISEIVGVELAEGHPDVEVAA